MPQELYVLRCYSCNMYQAHIEKKSKKWQCKICNEKQSVQVIYFRGSGSECRNYVQSQNAQSIASIEQAKNVYTAIIDAWGLDCNAESDDSCDCGQRRSSIEAISRFLTNNDGDPAPENLLLSENSSKRRKIDYERNQTRSLPSRKNIQCESAKTKSNSFPQMNKKQISFGKWKKFLEDGESAKHCEETNGDGATETSSKGNLEDFLESQDTDSVNEEYPIMVSTEDLDGFKRCRNNPEDEENATIGELKSSQVDDSSDASSSAFRGIINNLFQDLNDDLDVELDF